MEIRLDSVLEKVVDNHYDPGVDWRLIDSLGDFDVPREYRARSFIKYDEFKRILHSGGFISSRDTVTAKWLALTGDGTFSLQTGRKERIAFINLEQVKMAVPKFNRVPFDRNLWEKSCSDACVQGGCVSRVRVNGAEQKRVVE